MTNLSQQIKEASQAYYSGNPIISDVEFDALLNKLKIEEPDNLILSTVGYGYLPEPGMVKVKHLAGTIGSLDKIKIADINAGYKFPYESTIVTPKLDGGSAVAYYKKGKLDRIVTRGDGEIGIDITQNLLHAVPHTIPIEAYDIAVRGEVVLTYEGFEKLGKGSHPRNMAVGLSQSKHSDHEEIKLLKFVVYSIIGSKLVAGVTEKDNASPAKIFQLIILKKLGFIIPTYEQFDWDCVNNLLKDEHSYIHNMNDMFYQSEDGEHYPVDGLVISANDFETKTNENGWTEITNESIAFKFKEESTSTKVIDIEWNLNRTGRFTPVLIIEPVNLAGATINRVTGNNYEWVKEWECGVGSTIEIVRANEVIPKLVDVIEKSVYFNAPTYCPNCESILELTGVHLMCVNESCPSKLGISAYRMIEMFAEDGVGEILLERIMEVFGVERPKHWNRLRSYNYTVIAEDIEKEIGSGITGIKLYEVIKRLLKHKPTVYDILWCSNIPNIGTRTLKAFSKLSAKEFMENYKNPPESWRTLCSTYLAWDNLIASTDKITEIIEGFGGELMEDVKETSISKLNWKVCVTGGVMLPRKKWFEKLAQFGIEEGTVKNSDYIVSNETSGSSKAKEAAAIGKSIIDEESFYIKIAEAFGITMKGIKEQMVS